MVKIDWLDCKQSNPLQLTKQGPQLSPPLGLHTEYPLPHAAYPLIGSLQQDQQLHPRQGGLDTTLHL